MAAVASPAKPGSRFDLGWHLCAGPSMATEMQHRLGLRWRRRTVADGGGRVKPGPSHPARPRSRRGLGGEEKGRGC